MKSVYQNELVKVNRASWEKVIRNAIAEWEEFSTSCFCDTEPRKEAARAVVRKLHQMLETLLTEGGVTEKQFEWFRNLL